MSKDKHFGTTLDGIYRTPGLRNPEWRVYIWNPNRTTINDVVMDQAESPKYDITPWVQKVSLTENANFENSEDATIGSATLTIQYDEGAYPIQVTEKTLLDGTPIRIYQGDSRVPEDEWVCVFTGVIQGNPRVVEESRTQSKSEMVIIAADRSASFSATVVTAKSYEQGVDIGRAVVETAIEFMGLDRQEVRVGFQDFPIGHESSQLVDMEVMNGLYQMLFCVGKKPRFDAEGFLVAADADLDKAPARIYTDKDLVVSIIRLAVNSDIYNAVRLLGLSNVLSKIVEREKRLAHGTITSGWFEDEVKEKIYFSENGDSATAGRKAQNTHLSNVDIAKIADISFGANVTWSPFLEEDGTTCFGGEVNFDTGSEPTLRAVLIATWLTLATVDLLDQMLDFVGGIIGDVAFSAAWMAEKMALLAILYTFTELGRVSYEIWGEPVTFVFEQLCATAQVQGLLSGTLREKEMRNDWIYDIDDLEDRAKELLKREVVKAWVYEIVLIDDPIVEVDDVIQILDKKYYVTAIGREIERGAGYDGTMVLTTWRVE